MTKKNAVVAYIGVIVAFGLAIGLYHGGNFANSSLHFQWTTNFISDLGLSSARISAASQPLVRILFSVAMLLTGLAIVGATASTIQSSQTIRRAQLALATGTAGLALAVTFIPSDVHNYLHRLVFVILLIVAAILWLTFIPALTGYRRIVAIITEVVLWTYLVFVFVAPHPEASQLFGLIHAQIEKSVFLIFLISLATLVFNFPKRESPLY